MIKLLPLPGELLTLISAAMCFYNLFYKTETYPKSFGCIYFTVLYPEKFLKYFFQLFWFYPDRHYPVWKNV